MKGPFNLFRDVHVCFVCLFFFSFFFFGLFGNLVVFFFLFSFFPYFFYWFVLFCICFREILLIFFLNFSPNFIENYLTWRCKKEIILPWSSHWEMFVKFKKKSDKIFDLVPHEIVFFFSGLRKDITLTP